MATPVEGPLRRRRAIEGSTLVFAFAIGLLLVIVGYPLLWLFMAAFGIPGDLQLGYLARVYTRAQNFAPLVNTLILAFGAGMISVVLGVPLAWATARSDMPLRRTVQALVALAYITPPYLTAIAYIILLGTRCGLLQPRPATGHRRHARAHRHLQHGRRHLRDRDARFPVHLFHDPQRPALGRRVV